MLLQAVYVVQSRSDGRELLDKVLQECAITSVDRLHFNLAVQEDTYLVSHGSRCVS